MTSPQLYTISPPSTSHTNVCYIEDEPSVVPSSGWGNYVFWQSESTAWEYTPAIDNGQLEQRFNKLAKKWKEETVHLSFIEQIVLHPAYQEIIGLGKKAVSLIMHQLEKEPNFWFWALRSLTSEDPVTKDIRGDVMAMRDVWLEWGRKNGYL